MHQPTQEFEADAASLTLQELSTRLAAHTPRLIPAEDDWRSAAVAAIFRDGPSGTELLFIERARHPNDPWSGQIGFPGGRVEAADLDELAAARRETREEIGLDLSSQGGITCLGPLNQIQARARQKIMPMVISPFAFALHDSNSPAPLQLNHEVEAAFWVPLAELASAQKRVWHESSRAEIPFRFRAIDLGRRVPLWGLTHRMAVEVLGLLGLVRDVDALTLPQAKP